MIPIAHLKDKRDVTFIYIMITQPNVSEFPFWGHGWTRIARILKVRKNQISVEICVLNVSRLGISILYWNHVVFNDTGFMPPTWNDGILESWSKTHNFSVWIKVIGINFYCFSMKVLINTWDYHSFMAIMAFPDKWLSLFDVEKLFKAQNTTSWPPARRGYARFYYKRCTGNGFV